MKALEGKIAVVAGATRGAGRGIACLLGEAGATVYCTGRSIRGKPSNLNRPETIEETAEMVSKHGGDDIWAQVDHTDEQQVKTFFERVKNEQGRLDILVNDVWGGDALTEENWCDAAKKDRHFAESETPFYVGRAVAALTADPHVWKNPAGHSVRGNWRKSMTLATSMAASHISVI